MNRYSSTLIATSFALCLHSCLMVTSAYCQSGSRNFTPERRSSIPSQLQAAPQRYPSDQHQTGIEQYSRTTGRIGFDQFDHRDWDSLLQKYVDRDGNVAYPNWQADAGDRRALVEYLRRISTIDTTISSTRDSEMAFWINTYNALTMEGILQVFPTRSIKDHAPDANGFNIWDDFKLPIDGREYSLNDIEHKVLRKMGDPRIHFAIVCASRGCPQLSRRAYLPQSLDRQLTDNAMVFFRSPDKFRYNEQRRQIEVSPIIEWFGEDFGRNDRERMLYLARFMPSDAAARLASSGLATISYLNYDWNLNLAATTSRRPVAANPLFDQPQCPNASGHCSGR